MPNFKIEITEQELQVISEALGAAPFSRVAPVVARLQQQINAQLLAPPAPLTPPPLTPPPM